MKINNITAYDYYLQNENSLVLILGCSVDEALKIDTSLLEVKTDDGNLVEAFGGYRKRSAAIDIDTGRVSLLCYLDTDGSGAAVDALAKQLTAEKQKNADLQAQVEEQALAIEELAAMIAGTEE